MESVVNNIDKIFERFNDQSENFKELQEENGILRKQLKNTVRWFATGILVIVIVFSLILTSLR
jgi:cytoskeletal protein RodZ